VLDALDPKPACVYKLQVNAGYDLAGVRVLRAAMFSPCGPGVAPTSSNLTALVASCFTMRPWPPVRPSPMPAAPFATLRAKLRAGTFGRIRRWTQFVARLCAASD